MTKTVELHTTAGVIRLELDEEKAPLTVANFVDYVNAGHYDGTVFHRVIKGFMIQGGGFEPGMKQKPTKGEIQNEANNGLKNDKYTIAMARTSAPHSASAQFFINATNNDFLNFKSESAQGWGYAVFGKVVAGTEVVDQIEKVKTGRKGFHDDVPLEDVMITKAVVI
ncbi:cyclophilin [Aquabacterium sp. NJ1]|uniref:peptidylprolyl isomerase n=1 Tax=Aquabacterium sp. NJ1 TaxID=1538295 RepID=UPI00052CE9F3|nr:peptidylprolyl isomerase [Aquabacterium sp. NJ1]KGM41660.1 cyclophilin [Aquabacterium sp. NJ1]